MVKQFSLLLLTIPTSFILVIPAIIIFIWFYRQLEIQSKLTFFKFLCLQQFWQSFSGWCCLRSLQSSVFIYFTNLSFLVKLFSLLLLNYLQISACRTRNEFIMFFIWFYRKLKQWKIIQITFFWFWQSFSGYDVT